jgi:hypothetical protein
MEMKKLVKGLIVAGAMVAGGGAIAATQGTLGPTSTGTVDIIVGVGDQIQITALADITGPYVPGSDFTGSSPACVYRNGGSGDFDLTITSANGSGIDFRLNDAGTFVVYDVTFNDSVSGAVNMDNNVTDNVNFTNADTASPTCGGAPQSTLAINVPDANLAAVAAGTYSDTLTIVVAPR